MSSTGDKHPMNCVLKQAILGEAEWVLCDVWDLGTENSRSSRSLEGEAPLPEQLRPGQGSREGHRGYLGMAGSRQ